MIIPAQKPTCLAVYVHPLLLHDENNFCFERLSTTCLFVCFFLHDLRSVFQFCVFSLSILQLVLML